MVRVEIYGKEDCPLCDEAKDAARAAQHAVAFELKYVDITTDPELEARYRFDIPVIHVDGHKAFKHRVDPDDLADRVRRAEGAAR